MERTASNMVGSTFFQRHKFPYDLAVSAGARHCGNLRIAAAPGDDGVLVVNPDGTESKLPADRIILATGVKQNRALAEKLLADGFDVRLIGDCSDDPHGFVADAVRGGFLLGRSL